MPASVVIPTRLRVDPVALTHSSADIDDALAAAVTRALGQADEATRRRPGTLSAVFAEPTFAWGGEGLPQVDAATRERIEALVRDVLKRAPTAVVRRPTAGTVRSAPAETVDRSRLDGFASVYELPSYDQAGDSARIPLATSEVDLMPGSMVARWVPLPLASVRAALQARIRELGLPSTHGYYGTIFQWNEGGHIVALFRDEDAEAVWDAHLMLDEWTFNPGRHGWEPSHGTLFSSTQYWLTWASGSSESDARRALEAFYPNVLESEVRRRTEGAALLESEIAGIVARQAQAVVNAEIVAMRRSNTQSLWILTMGEGRYMIKSDLPLPSDALNIPLVSLVQVLEERPSLDDGDGGTGTGGRGGGSGSLSGGGTKGHGATAPGQGQTGQAGQGDRGSTGGSTGAQGDTAGGTTGVAEEGGGLVIGEDGAEGGAMFPTSGGESDRVISCDRYEGEPSIDDLGQQGARLREVIHTIAHRLDMPALADCKYAGGFLLAAAEMLRVRAEAVAGWGTPERAQTRSTPDGDGNLGHIEFVALPSTHMQLLRQLAATVPWISTLHEGLKTAINAMPEKIEGTWQNRAASWTLRFDYDLNTTMSESVGRLFAMTCQVVFLQLLGASRDAIDARLTDLDTFTSYFEQAVLPQLRSLDELLRMQQLLSRAESLVALSQYNPESFRSAYPDVQIAIATPAPRPQVRSSTWHDATQSFTDALTPQQSSPAPPQPPAPARADHYELVPEVGGTFRILDKDGRLWTADDLGDAVLLRRGTVESVEPLVKQMVDLPEVMERFRRPGMSVRDELGTILRDMSAKNDDITGRARDDLDYGFKASSITESTRSVTVPGAGFALQGVHLLAHQQIGEFFAGDAYYGMGVDFLMSAELGKESLIAFAEFTGIVLLAVLCPPLAVDVGIGLAAYHYAQAAEHEEVWGALIDPELVRSRAQIEAELFAAELGLALSFLPVAGEIAGEARAALRVAEEGLEAAEAGTQAASSSAESLLTNLARVLEHGLGDVFINELAKAWLINKAFELALAPVMAAIQRNVEAHGPQGGLERALIAVVERQRERREARQH